MINKIYIILKYYKVFRVFYKFVLLIIYYINYHIDNDICYINEDNGHWFIIICIAGSFIFVSLMAGLLIPSEGWEDLPDDFDDLTDEQREATHGNLLVFSFFSLSYISSMLVNRYLTQRKINYLLKQSADKKLEENANNTEKPTEVISDNTEKPTEVISDNIEKPTEVIEVISDDLFDDF